MEFNKRIILIIAVLSALLTCAATQETPGDEAPSPSSSTNGLWGGSIPGGIICVLIFISLVVFVVRKFKHMREKCKVNVAPEHAIKSNNDDKNNDIKIEIHQ